MVLQRGRASRTPLLLLFLHAHRQALLASDCPCPSSFASLLCPPTHPSRPILSRFPHSPRQQSVSHSVLVWSSQRRRRRRPFSRTTTTSLPQPASRRSSITRYGLLPPLSPRLPHCPHAQGQPDKAPRHAQEASVIAITELHGHVTANSLSPHSPPPSLTLSLSQG